MAAPVTRAEVLKIYKTMLRESGKFSFYNYRMYAIRRVKDAFREQKAVNDKSKIQQQLLEAHKFLNIIKRQVIVGDLYKFDKLVIEVENNGNNEKH
ncbi:PREDICTED: LYR motif-containing protein 4 [Diuraphis noxia]|uniref:LYR motif-containing protein 4 n=1 Tax=Diuraphis noxia TaxID=143948 RepID=UPI0007639ACD|nr:PREDICTED: LYR motif-containing protein 4 [Diuraphis noxia]